MPDHFLADLAQTAAATTANIHRESISMPQRQFRGLVPPTHLLKPGNCRENGNNGKKRGNKGIRREQLNM